jgi:hypothetical protein
MACPPFRVFKTTYLHGVIPIMRIFKIILLIVFGLFIGTEVSIQAQSLPVNVSLSDQKPGSMLVFPLYTSSTTTPTTHDTRWTITNTSDTEDVTVHLFLISATEQCQQADKAVCIKRRCSMEFLASDYDPDSRGYVMALAINSTTGVPIQKNVLIGNAFVKAPAGALVSTGGIVEGNYAAESFRAITDPATGNVSTSPETFTLQLNGLIYDRVGKMLGTMIQEPTTAPGQTIVTIGLRGSIATTNSDSTPELDGAAQSGVGLVHNSIERGSSFSGFLTGDCFAKNTIDSRLPRTVPRLTSLLGGSGGGFGIMRIPIIGGVGLLITPKNTAVGSMNFYGITPLHKITQTTVTLEVPVITPDC